MQSVELHQGQLRKSLEIFGRYALSGDLGESIGGCGKTPAYDFPHNLCEGGPIFEPKGVGLWKRIADRLVATRRALIGPNEYIAQKLNSVELVNADQSVNVSLLGNVDEGQ